MGEGIEATGTVTAVIRNRGYGFIRSSAHPTDIFFHRDAIEDLRTWETLDPGAEVSFTLVETDKGTRAVKVQRR